MMGINQWRTINNKNFCPFSFFGQIRNQYGKWKKKSKEVKVRK